MAPKPSASAAAAPAPRAAAAADAAAAEADALRTLLAASLPQRKREEVLGSDDIFVKLNLARYRDAALNLKGARLFSKVQTATPAVLHDPPGCVCGVVWID
jgi:hypothetical protein